VEAHVTNGKLRDAKRAAHALKGLCAQFGANEVTAVAKSIEEKSETLADVTALLPRLEISIKQTEAALAAHFKKTRRGKTHRVCFLIVMAPMKIATCNLD
jgi:HPt (histidine-containing phosphotransfer) domain-containing protein